MKGPLGHARDALPWLIPTLITARQLWGLSAGPHPFDAGELTAAATLLSGSHPPGQMLHAVLGHAMTLLPVGPIPLRVALLSTLCVLGAGLAAGRAARLLCEHVERPDWAPWAATVAASMFMCAPPVGRQAGRVEVYGLAFALTAWSLLNLLRFALRGERGALLRAAGVAGLAAATHPPHALALALVGAALSLTYQRWVFARPWLLAAATAACLGSFAAVAAYLPLRGLSGAPMWGDPTTLPGLLSYLSAATYTQNTSVGTADRALLWVDYARHAIIMIGVAPPLALLWLTRRADAIGTLARTLAAASLLTVAAVSLQPLQPWIPDHVAYMGPVLLVWSIGGAVALTAALGQTNSGWRRRLSFGALLLFGSAPAAWLGPLDYIDNDQPVLETLASALAESAPPRALLVTTTDFAAAAFMQASAVDGARPDCAQLASGLATSSWHWKQLGGHPAFDGLPHRGLGHDAKAAYTDGAIRTALWTVPVALEHELDRPVTASLAGPLLIMRAGGDSPAVVEDNIGERLAPTLARENAGRPPSDHDTVGAIMRDHLLLRADRLLERRQVRPAIETMLAAAPRLPRDIRVRMRAVEGPRSRPRPPTLRDKKTYLFSEADAERRIATELWALGAIQVAYGLMNWQSVRDPRAHLQLALFARLDGDRISEKKSLQTFLALAPELSEEVTVLQGLEP